MQCKLISIWHDAPHLLIRDNLIASEHTPVPYSCGEGLYTIMGYIGSVKDDHISIILDNSFTITTGRPPTDDETLLVDEVKTAIASVISKIMVVVKIQTEEEITYQIDKIPESDVMPSQLKEINKWIYTKLAVDYNFTLAEGQYQPEHYFPANPTIRETTSLVSKFDQYISLSKQIVHQFTDEINHSNLHIDYMTEMDDHLAHLMDDTAHLRSVIKDMIDSKQEAE